MIHKKRKIIHGVYKQENEAARILVIHNGGGGEHIGRMRFAQHK